MVGANRGRARKRGFSLVELLATIAILILLMTSSLPAINEALSSGSRRGAVIQEIIGKIIPA